MGEAARSMQGEAFLKEGSAELLDGVQMRPGSMAKASGDAAILAHCSDVVTSWCAAAQAVLAEGHVPHQVQNHMLLSVSGPGCRPVTCGTSTGGRRHGPRKRGGMVARPAGQVRLNGLRAAQVELLTDFPAILQAVRHAAATAVHQRKACAGHCGRRPLTICQNVA